MPVVNSIFAFLKGLHIASLCYRNRVDSSLYLKVPSEKPTLRIGLLLDSVFLPRCVAEVVDHIGKSNFAKVELLIYNTEAQTEESEPKQPRSIARKIIETFTDSKQRKRFLFSLYQRWDLRNIEDSNDPLALIDYSDKFKQIESLSVTPIRKRFVHRFPPEAIDQIRSKKLDILLRFGFNILRGDVLTAAQFGIWSYHHGDNDYYRGGPAYFWEVYEGNPISGAILQVLTEELDAGKVLCKGLFSSDSGRLSHAKNRLQPYWGASTFIIQKLCELQKYGWEHIQQNMVKPAPYLGKKKIYSTPTNWEMLQWLGPLILQKAYLKLVRQPKIQHWMLAVRTGASSVMDTAPSPVLSGFRWIESPKGQFYADPFLIEVDGKMWVFYEDYDYAKKYGKISCSELRQGELGKPVTAIDRPTYHLSYPCVFRDGGKLFMIPESDSLGTVDLYRCVQFPDTWEVEKELYRGHAVDTTIWIEHGIYWFFVTIWEPRGGATQLWLFHADSIDGKWTTHPASPLSTDVRYSRGGGAVFKHNGKLFRPSQDCSKIYGGSFTLNEIVVLDRNNYQEQPFVTVNPDWGDEWVGTHTYCRLGDVEIIDGCRSSPLRNIL